jgi:Xaa-Pro aminopeptidase
MSINLKIKQLRSKIKDHQLSGYIVPSNDEFQSEYVPDYSNRLKFISGFSGSNGLALITLDEAIFFTDGRYILQAKQEIGQYFQIHNLTELYRNSFFKGKIGYDPKLHTSLNISHYNNSNLVPCKNLVDLIWLDKPKPEPSMIFSYPIKYAGESSQSKSLKIQNHLKEQGIDALIISDPTNICWLLNIRAHDVEYNPVLLSHLIFYQDGKIELFHNDPSSKPLEEKDLEKIANKKVQIDPHSASTWIANQLKQAILQPDPCTLAKACKNNIEIAQARRIHAIDGTAMCKFLYWLETTQDELNELDIEKKLLKFRQLHPDFLYPSFATIAGFAEHGAIIHYHATENTNKTISGNGLLLIDSGGQYFGGTTDITRVIPIGKATAEQKLNFTLVLKGHIALAKSIFPIGTSGADLDALARYHLWQHGKDYAHGTGHGVGNLLSVHEGPQRISKLGTEPLRTGMIISNEPGYYKTGEYGIRIESLLLVKQFKNNYLKMETLSLAPIEQKLILKKLLSPEEIKWLNLYHQKIYQKLSPYLSHKEKAWLQHKTKAL